MTDRTPEHLAVTDLLRALRPARGRRLHSSNTRLTPRGFFVFHALVLLATVAAAAGVVARTGLSNEAWLLVALYAPLAMLGDALEIEKPDGTFSTFSDVFIISSIIVGGAQVGTLVVAIATVSTLARVQSSWLTALTAASMVAMPGWMGIGLLELTGGAIDGTGNVELLLLVLQAMLIFAVTNLYVAPFCWLMRRGVDRETGQQIAPVTWADMVATTRTQMSAHMPTTLVGSLAALVNPLAAILQVVPFVHAWVSAQHLMRLHHVEQRAASDALTGLFNRWGLTAQVARLRRAAVEEGAERPAMAVLLGDLDDFKQINDLQGHAAGDEALERVADQLRALDSPGAIAARYGGEEFVLVLPGSDLAAGMGVAEQLRAAVQGDDRGTPLTISIGVASFDPVAELGFETALDQADRAMYGAKRAGKNRVCAAVEPDADAVDPSTAVRMVAPWNGRERRAA